MTELVPAILGWAVAVVIAAVAYARLSAWRRWARSLSAGIDGRALDANSPSAHGDEQERVVRSLSRMSADLSDATRRAGRLARVVDGMVEGIVVVDGEGVVVIANERAVELLDLPRQEEHVGRLLAELTRHPDVHDLVAEARREKDWGQAIVRDISIAGSQELTLRVSASRLTPLEDIERWFVLVFHDVSVIRQVEGMRRDFVANVSHELRTPLAAIAGYTETLLDGALEDEDRARRFLEIIDRHNQRLGRLVDDLLTLSDLELGRTELNRGAEDLRRIAGACCETLAVKAESGGVLLENEVSPDLPLVDGDADRLEQALLNVIENAIKYTPSGGTVRISAALAAADEWVEDGEERTAELVEISIADTGVGVSPDHLERLTERFYRVDKVRSRELGGTGLGLAIVKHIVQAHGGSMSIESEVGKGTIVRLLLPSVDDFRDCPMSTSQ